MIFQMLRPLDKDLLNYVDSLPSQSLGKKVSFFKGGEFEDFSSYQIAIVGVTDNRGLEDEGCSIVDITKIRKSFYSLFPGNWSSRIIDFGDVAAGQTIEDTYFLLKNVVSTLLKHNVICVILGGSQDLTYAVYRAYDDFEQAVNLVAIDSKLDLAKDNSKKADCYLSRVIMDEPTNLFNFSNLGYQTYFNSQEELDLLENLYFEAYRVGEIANNLRLVEPVLRDADIVSMDLRSVMSGDSGNFSQFNPNGLNGREICGIARYAGLSDRVTAFGLFNYQNQATEAMLIAQVMWYFIEGLNFRYNEFPALEKTEYLKYIVPVEGYDDFIFYKSPKSQRWWIEFGFFVKEDKSNRKQMLLPCTHEDYEETINQQVPERWLRMLKRSFV